MDITLPPRRDYIPEPTPLETLPFVYRPGRRDKKAKRSNWKLPPVDDYALACELGREYAAHFVQYLKDNPFWVGKNLLGLILADIDYRDCTAAKGCHVGFFSHLERLLYAQAVRMDVFEDVDRLRRHHADTLTDDM